MKDFASNKSFFYFINKQKASADAPKPTKNDTIQLETNVIDIEKARSHLKLLSNTSKLQNLIDPRYHESCEMHVINDIQNLNVPDTTHTTGLVLEVTIAIKLSSDDNCQTIMLNKVLIDTGCTKTIIKRNTLPDQFFESEKQSKEITWTTNAGKFVTKYEIPLQFSLPEFAPSREISWNVAVDDTAQQSKYEMIIGRDLQLALGMEILFSTKHLKWDGIAIPMRTQHTDLSYIDSLVKNLGNSQDVFATASTPMSILDAKYEKANIDATINTFKHLNGNQQQQLKALLYKFEHLFDGTLGDWTTEPVSFKLKEGAKPFQLSPFPVPKIHEDTLKKEIQRLCNLGVLKPQVAS
jgi:Retroviral aspartyl protease